MCFNGYVPDMLDASMVRTMMHTMLTFTDGLPEALNEYISHQVYQEKTIANSSFT